MPQVCAVGHQQRTRCQPGRPFLKGLLPLSLRSWSTNTRKSPADHLKVRFYHGLLWPRFLGAAFKPGAWSHWKRKERKNEFRTYYYCVPATRLSIFTYAIAIHSSSNPSWTVVSLQLRPGEERCYPWALRGNDCGAGGGDRVWCPVSGSRGGAVRFVQRLWRLCVQFESWLHHLLTVRM